MTEQEFFESKGLPYRLENMGQMFGSVASAGSQTAVVVRVGDGIKDRFYVGYYNPIEATNKAAELRRVRKFPVSDVGQFRGSPFADSL